MSFILSSPIGMFFLIWNHYIMFIKILSCVIWYFLFIRIYTLCFPVDETCFLQFQNIKFYSAMDDICRCPCHTNPAMIHVVACCVAGRKLPDKGKRLPSSGIKLPTTNINRALVPR